MKKKRSKLLIAIMIVAVLLLISVSLIFYRIHYSPKCQNIIGDGYAMGTDPKPIVIGKNCEQPYGSIKFVQ